MNDIDSNNIFTQLGLNPTQDVNANSKDKDELGQTEFLELMTAQLRFQDPLKPMENGDFLAQMAQFGTVSGISDLNSNFSSMSASFQSNQALQASTLVGRQVLVPSTSASLTSAGPIRGSVDLQQPANEVLVTVKNTAGQLVHRQSLGIQQAGLADFEWNGTDESGNPMPAGQYQIAAEVHRGDDITSGSTLTVLDVESVSLGIGGQELTLSVAGLGDIGMSQVRRIL